MEEFRSIPLGELYETPLNNRRHFNEAALEDLTSSIRQKGVLTPLLVRERPHGGKRFEILAGARRYRGATRAELAAVPAMVRDLDDTAALEVVVIENLQREDLNALDEAEGYEQLLKQPGYDVAAIAAKVGKSESSVHQRLKLLELIEPARKALLDEAITPGHGLLLARLQPNDQKEALAHCFDERWVRNTNKREKVLVSVRELASYIEGEIMLDLHAAAFKKDDAALVPKAGACTTCPKRTGYAPALFADLAKKDLCTDRGCFKAKIAAHLAQQQAALEASGETVVKVTREWSTKSKGVLADQQWQPAEGKKKCGSATPALVVEGSRDVGKVLQVCTDKTCKVHHPYGGCGRTTQSPAELARQKRRQEEAKQKTEVRQRTFLAVHDAAPTTGLARPELERIALGFIDEMQNDSRKLLASTLRVEVPKQKHQYGGVYYEYAKTLQKWARGLDDAELTRLIVLLPLVHGLEGHEYHEGSKGLLKAAAAQYGVRIPAIEKIVAAEFKEKAKERTERKAKVKKKAKGAKAKGGAGKGKALKKATPTKPARAKQATATARPAADVDDNLEAEA